MRHRSLGKANAGMKSSATRNFNLGMTLQFCHNGPIETPPTAAAPHEELKRSLGLFDSTMLVAGSMIGSGIFIVSADMARGLGSTGWLLAPG